MFLCAFALAFIAWVNVAWVSAWVTVPLVICLIIACVVAVWCYYHVTTKESKE